VRKVPQQGPGAEELVAAAVRTLADKKGLDPVVLDVRGLCGFADYFLIVSGASRRQVLALADYLLQALKEVGGRPLGTEGLEEGSWVLLDFNDVVIHLLSPALREFYNLEGLWSEAHRPPLEQFLGAAPPPPS